MNAIGKRYSGTSIKYFVQKYMIYIVLVGIIILMTILKPDVFLTYKNAINIFRQMTFVGLMSLGVLLCVITGGCDLSGSSVIALCSCVAASFAQYAGDPNGPGQYPLIVPIVLTIVTGAVIGTINGFFIAYGKIAPFIATLGMMSIARGLALIVSNGKPIGNLSKDFLVIGGGDLFGIPIPVIIFVFFAVLMYFLLHKSRFGTYIYAIGGNENAALVSGVRVKLVKMLVYTVAGIMTSIAGLVLASRIASGQPGAGAGYDMDSITCAVIGGASLAGGVGSVPGAFIGAMIIGILTNGMTMLQIDPNLQLIVKGVVILGAILLDESKNRNKK